MEKFLDRSHAYDQINADSNSMVVDEWKNVFRRNSGSNSYGYRNQAELVVQPFKSLINRHLFGWCFHDGILPPFEDRRNHNGKHLVSIFTGFCELIRIVIEAVKFG